MPAKPLNQISGMPQMSAAFEGWMSKITFSKIVQSVVDGLVVNTPVPITIDGTWQPLDPEEIKLKPDGERSWEWIDLHVRGKNIIFATTDRVDYQGLLYKVMAVRDYTLNNYSEYHLIRDYQDG